MFKLFILAAAHYNIIKLLLNPSKTEFLLIGTTKFEKKTCFFAPLCNTPWVFVHFRSQLYKDPFPCLSDSLDERSVEIEIVARDTLLLRPGWPSSVDRRLGKARPGLHQTSSFGLDATLLP